MYCCEHSLHMSQPPSNMSGRSEIYMTRFRYLVSKDGQRFFVSNIIDDAHRRLH